MSRSRQLILSLVVLMLVTVIAITARQLLNNEVNRDFTISYTTSNETQSIDIKVEGKGNSGTIIYKHVKSEYTSKCDNPFISEKCWSDSDIVTDNLTLKAEDYKKFSELIKKYDYAKLNAVYGEQDLTARYYGTTFTVYVEGEGNSEKIIQYRAGRDTEVMPVELSELQNIILSLVK